MKTPGKKAASWIENFCVVPAGFDKGQHVHLSVEQRETVRRIFDTDESSGEITAPLSSYLVLLALAGPRALAERITGIELGADVFTTWAAVGPDLNPCCASMAGLSLVGNCGRNFHRWPPSGTALRAKQSGH
jgi:hypothetical protein